MNQAPIDPRKEWGEKVMAYLVRLGAEMQQQGFSDEEIDSASRKFLEKARMMAPPSQIPAPSQILASLTEEQRAWGEAVVAYLVRMEGELRQKGLSREEIDRAKDEFLQKAQMMAPAPGPSTLEPCPRDNPKSGLCSADP